MQGTTGSHVYQLVWVVLHALVVLSILGLALLGQLPAEAAGWPIAFASLAALSALGWLAGWLAKVR